MRWEADAEALGPGFWLPNAPEGRLGAAAIVETSRLFTAAHLVRHGYVERRPLGIVRIDDALLTRRDYFPGRKMNGAVYDAAGRRFDPALRPPSIPDDLVNVDPERIVRSPTEGSRRYGRLLYGGTLFGTLGHVLVETLARLWPYVPAWSGEGPRPRVVFHAWPDLAYPGFWRNPLYRAIFGALGIRPRDLRLVHLRDLRADTLLCPSPASVLHETLHPALGIVLDTIGDRLAREPLRARLVPRRRPAMPGRIFLSRSLWPSNRRVADEGILDDVFRDLGFAVLHPEAAKPDDLLRRLRAADVVASADGSHAHLAAFCRPGTRALLLDARLVPTQFALAQLQRLRAFHVPLGPCGLLGPDRTIGDPAPLAAALATILGEDLFLQPPVVP